VCHMVPETGNYEEGDRFAFGENWRDFSRSLDSERVAGARAGIERLLGLRDLSALTFLDIGCGSGLMSLAAHEMGAKVTAFDYDADSVATTIAIRDAAVGSTAYGVTQGSALDDAFVSGLGQFDISYSWGVLHHRGDLWLACRTVVQTVKPGGLLAIAIYNDQGLASRVWTRVKKAYIDGGPARRRALVAGFGGYFRSREAFGDLLSARHRIAAAMHGEIRMLQVFHPGLSAESATPRPRGMDRRHDLVDWVGGYPFQVAKPEEIFDFFFASGFQLERLTTCAGGLGCNEYVFRRNDHEAT
jgi:SAM-dependent methyltransferase